MNIAERIEKIRRQIARNNTQEVFEDLEILLEDLPSEGATRYRSTILLILGKFHHLRNGELEGLISKEMYLVSHAKLTKSIINLLTEIEKSSPLKELVEFQGIVKDAIDTQIEHLKVILSEKDALKLYFDLDEFSKEDILNIISLLSEIYRSIGGDGIVIKKLDTLEFSTNLMPA